MHRSRGDYTGGDFSYRGLISENDVFLYFLIRFVIKLIEMGYFPYLGINED